jgi:hypothetical protein
MDEYGSRNNAEHPTSGQPRNNCFPFAASRKAATRKIEKPIIIVA